MLVTVAISMAEFDVCGVHIGFSSLLVCMMLGTVFCNICPLSGDLMEKADGWICPLYVLFFVISGAELELSVFSDWAIVGVGVYILFRSLASMSAHIPAAHGLRREGHQVSGRDAASVAGRHVRDGRPRWGTATAPSSACNIILFSVLIYELVGPALTKIALTKARRHPAQERRGRQPPPDQAGNRRSRKTGSNL